MSIKQKAIGIQRPRWGVDGSARNKIAELPGIFIAGFIFTYLKGFLSTLATVEIPAFLDNTLLLAGFSFLLLHLFSSAQLLGKRLLLCFPVLALMAACYVLSSDSSPFFACLVFFCAISLRNVRPLIKVWFWVTCVLVTLNSLVYGLQVFAGLAEITYRIEDGVRTVRFSLGFVHPNMAGAFLFWLCGCGLYLRDGKRSFADYALVMLISIFVIVVVDSKTSGYLTAILPFLFWIQDRRHIFTKNRKIRFLFGLLPIAMFLLTFSLAGPLYNSTVGELFTGRPWLWHACLENQGLTLFGHKFQVARSVGYDGFTWNAITLDSFYANGLMVSGILFSSLFCVVFFIRCRRNDVTLEAAMPFLLLALLFGFTEGHLLDICFGFPLILLCSTAFSVPATVPKCRATVSERHVRSRNQKRIKIATLSKNSHLR